MLLTMTKATAIVEQELTDNPLPLDDYMKKQIVDDYLLFYIPERSGIGVKHVHERIYRYIPEFIRWWADQVRTDALTMADAHALTERFVEEFAIQKTESEHSRMAVNATLSSFAGNTLEVFLTNPWKRLVKGYDTSEAEPGHVYTLEELEKFYEGIGRIARGGGGFTRDQTRQRYWNWVSLLLQTGLRESHAAMFTYRDIFDSIESFQSSKRRSGEGAMSENFLGDMFYPIPALSIVKRHKEEIGDKISKTKAVAKIVYIHDGLYNDILNLYNEARPQLDSTLLGVSQTGMRKVGNTIKQRMWMEKFTWSLRHTWASAFYVMTGGNLKAVANAGGWKSTAIPFRHYIEVMTTSDAYHIVKKYHIHIPPELNTVAWEIERTVLSPAAPRPTPGVEGAITVTPAQLAEMIRAEVERALKK